MLWVQSNQLIFWICEAGEKELSQEKKIRNAIQGNRNNAHIEQTISRTAHSIHFLLTPVIIGFHHVDKLIDS